MLMSIGYLLFFLLRVWSNRRRQNMLHRVLRETLKSTSVYIQRVSPLVQGSGAGSVIRSPLIKGNLAFEESMLLHASNVTLTSVNPMQVIDLSEWTAYYHPADKSCSGEGVTVFMETTRPRDVNMFLEHELEVAPAEKVHVMSIGTLVAWHSGTPFGILLKCSEDALTRLTLAFVDGTLTMDEDLEVLSMMTVKTEGSCSPLCDKYDEGLQQGSDVNNSNVFQSAYPRPRQVESLLASALGEEQASDLWSNESLASNSDIGRVELLDMLDSDLLDGDNNGGSVNESGAGEGLSEFNLEDSSSSTSGSLSQSWRVVQSSQLVKPPNVLIYTGKIDSVRKFEKVQKVFEHCLDLDCYVMYHLKHEDIETTPWADNTALLVLASKKRYADTSQAVLNYFKGGGHIISFGSGVDPEFLGQTLVRQENWVSQLTYKTWTNVSLISGIYSYNVDDVKLSNCKVKKLGSDKEGNACIVKVTMETKGTASGMAVLSQVFLDKDAGDLGVTPEIFNMLKKSNSDRFEILKDLLAVLGVECNSKSLPSLTPAVLLTRTEALKTSFLKSIQSRLSSGVLKFGKQSLSFTGNSSEPVKENLLPVLTEKSDAVCDIFNQSRYFEDLSSQVLGNTVLYVDVVPTTMTLLDGLMFSIPEDTGLIAIARQQTSGKGRGGNAWLSPVGCAMFTLHVRVPADSNLGHAISYMQHIVSLAVVYSVCKMDGYQDVDLRLKWPNDIYYGRQMKLGGVIAKSTIMDGTAHITIGCGFNVDNSNPTICINDLIQLLNRQQGSNLALCSVEQLLARTVTYIEVLVEQFQLEGVEKFRQMYYEKWLHSESRVRLQSEGDMEVRIVGLDDFGYLLVESPSGERISVQQDGNSFDMMHNLITLKAR